MILHIPHSFDKFPSYEVEMSKDKNVLKTVEKYTDFRTNELFQYKGADRVVYPWSRVFCDVEKLEENEPMEELGLGILYEVSTKTRKYPKRALQTYKNHHDLLLKTTNKQLSMLNKTVIIDCHSFSDAQALELGYDSSDIDICLGTDKTHTPYWLTEMCIEHFNSFGYKVEVDMPYEGTIIPLKLYGNKDVISVMIEVNKKCYLNDNFDKMQSCITSLLEKIDDYNINT